MWAVRETIPEAGRRRGALATHDVALPLARLAGFIAAADAALARLAPGLVVNCFGHLGDGNLHYNVYPPKGEAAAAHAALREPVTRLIHDLVHASGGSVSAEHGIGRLRTGDLARYGDPGKLAAMRTIKRALDPLGILNPGAIFGEG
jgi:FAD/FMN-containing dehydrogenase